MGPKNIIRGRKQNTHKGWVQKAFVQVVPRFPVDHSDRIQLSVDGVDMNRFVGMEILIFQPFSAKRNILFTKVKI